MGRPSTGAWTCGEAKPLRLPYLIKKGYFSKGALVSGVLTWTDWRGDERGSISIFCSWVNDDIYMRLSYTHTDSQGRKEDFNYKIQLTTVPSNLGKGKVLYFICPASGKRCRILYKAYGYDKWKSREAYRNRLYYEAQISSKRDYANTRYWTLQRQIEKFKSEKQMTYIYNGKVTKRAIRLQRMEGKQLNWDIIRWSPVSFPKSLQGVFKD